MTEPKEQKGVLTVTETVRKMQPEFAELLKSSGTDEKKFMNNALMAIAAKPEIQKGEVTRKSVFDVCSRAANDGVVLDGKEAAMVLGSVKRDGKWVKEAQYRLMAGGALKIIQRSPNIERIVCQLVYENDDFLVDFVTKEEPIHHKITPEALKKGRGVIVGVYFTAKLKNGEWTSPEIMSVEEVNAVRDAYSKKSETTGKFSQMWENSWGEAAKKTVLHRARKRLPLDGSIDAIIAADNNETEIIDHNTGEVLNQPETAAETKPAKSKVADKVKAAAAAKTAKPEPQPDPEPTASEPDFPQDDDNIIDAEYTESEHSGEGEEEPPV